MIIFSGAGAGRTSGCLGIKARLRSSQDHSRASSAVANTTTNRKTYLKIKEWHLQTWITTASRRVAKSTLTRNSRPRPIPTKSLARRAARSQSALPPLLHRSSGRTPSAKTHHESAVRKRKETSNSTQSTNTRCHPLPPLPLRRNQQLSIQNLPCPPRRFLAIRPTPICCRSNGPCSRCGNSSPSIPTPTPGPWNGARLSRHCCSSEREQD